MFTYIKNKLNKMNITTKKEELLSEINQMEERLAHLKQTAKSIDQTKKLEDLKTWEDICEYSGRDPNKLPDVSMYDDEHKKYAIAAFKLPIIYKVRNGSWRADYSNASQKKWFVWFTYSPASSGRPAGFVYSHAGYDYDGTYSLLGSRFASETQEVAACVAQDFLELWNNFLLVNGK